MIGSLASNTVISILTTVRAKKGQKSSKTLMLFIMSCWNRTKPSLGNGIELNWCIWAEHCAKNGHNTSRGTKKWFYSMTTLGLTLPNPFKPTWKRSNGKSDPTRRIPQIFIYLFNTEKNIEKNAYFKGLILIFKFNWIQKLTSLFEKVKWKCKTFEILNLCS